MNKNVSIQIFPSLSMFMKKIHMAYMINTLKVKVLFFIYRGRACPDPTNKKPVSTNKT